MRAMKIHPLVYPVAAALLALAGLAASAQGNAPAQAPAASAPSPAKPPPRLMSPAKPPPRLMSPAETRDSATMPGEFRPEQPAKPQINIPLGKSADAPARPAARAASRSKTGPAGINDAVARCEAVVDASERAKCRDGLARQSGKR